MKKILVLSALVLLSFSSLNAGYMHVRAYSNGTDPFVIDEDQLYIDSEVTFEASVEPLGGYGYVEVCNYEAISCFYLLEYSTYRDTTVFGPVLSKIQFPDDRWNLFAMAEYGIGDIQATW